VTPDPARCPIADPFIGQDALSIVRAERMGHPI
jgi:hypothetical protein